MVKTTVLRVKRRRDEEPPPPTFTLQPFALSLKPASTLDRENASSSSKPKKQKENEESPLLDAAHLTQLMHNSTLLNERNNQLSSTTPDESSMIGRRTAPLPATAKNHDNLVPNSNETLPIEKNHSSAKDKRAIVFRRVVDGNDDSAFHVEYPYTPADTMELPPSSPVIKNLTMNENACRKRKLDIVHVVDARLDSITTPSNKKNSTFHDKKQISTGITHQQTQPIHHNDEDKPVRHPYQRQTKRKRISLQMVETRTMTGTEFWNAQRLEQQLKKQASPSTVEGKRLTSTSALRARMKRAAASTSHGLTAPQSLSSSRMQRQKQASKNIILDPLSKRIDASLCTLTTMATTCLGCPDTTTNDSNDPNIIISSHLQLIQSSIVPTKSKSKYLNWNCTNGAGTLLHVTALLNRADVAKYLFAEYVATLDLDLRDDGGQTAREVAETCGASGVVEVIDDYAEMMGIRINECHGRKHLNRRVVDSRSENKPISMRDQSAEEREEGDFVYDLYWIQEDENNDDKQVKKGEEGMNIGIKCEGDDNNRKAGDTSAAIGLSYSADNHCNRTGHKKRITPFEEKQQRPLVAAEANALTTIDMEEPHSNISSKISGGKQQGIKISSSKTPFDDAPITVQMHGSIGYWNEHGELVLEAANISNNSHNGSSGNNADMMTNWDDDDDDLDSNCEEFDGNDYPEEEDHDDEVIFSGMSHESTNQDSPFDLVDRYDNFASDSDNDGDHSNDGGDFRNRPVDLGNYEGFGQHHAKRGEGFYADYSNNAEDDVEDEEYSNYASAYTGELSSGQWGNQTPHAERKYAYDPDLDG